jgi:beta-N-acetylhexosaminidase
MTDLLRQHLGFTGLALSDDMGAMKAITDNFQPGDAAVRAVKAGVDMMILSAEIGRQRQARDGLLAAVESGDISRARLDEAVRHVLTAKAKFGLLPGTTAPASSGCP